jgi:hypothetical protein
LLNNLLETLTELLERHRGTLREVRESFRAAKAQLSDSHDSQDTLTKALQRKQQNRQRRLDLYQRMRELIDNGRSQTQAAAILGLGLRTVQRWIACGVFRERKHRAFSSQVDAFAPYLEKRVAEGCRNATVLWKEISRQGYGGKTVSVWDWLQRRFGSLRNTEAGALLEKRQSPLRLEKVAWLMLKTTPRRSPFLKALHSCFCGAEVSRPSSQKLLRDDPQAGCVAVASLATNGSALASGFLRSAPATR